MLIREKYLAKIRGFYHTESLIKIIYGMRRSGKSVILNQIIDEIIASGVDESNIIYINFESLKYYFIKNAKDLYNYIESLKKEYHEIANDTLYNYLEAFSTTFIMNKVYRYDIHGKNILKTLNKYYATDLGIKQIKTNNDEINYSTALENLVYNDLIIKDYKVFVGKTKKVR